MTAMTFSRFALFCTAICTASPFAYAGIPAVPPWGVDLSYLDKSVAPGNDFFLYGNGNWMKTAVIPPDRSYAGVNLEIDKQNEAKLRGLVEDLREKGAPSDEERKLRDFYAAFTNTVAIEAAGRSHAQADLDRITEIKTMADVATLMGTPALGLDGPYGIYLGVDDKHPGSYSVNLYQSGLGLPDRDYYLRDDKEIVETRAAYKKYLAQMLTFASAKNAEARADAVFKLKESMAHAHWPAADRRDADKTYNPMKVKDLEGMAPGFPWREFLSAAAIPMTSPKGERTASRRCGARKIVRRAFVNRSCPIRTARRTGASSALRATWMLGTTPSALNPATNTISRRISVCTSGKAN
jgi:putative endopeptidase